MTAEDKRKKLFAAYAISVCIASVFLIAGRWHEVSGFREWAEMLSLSIWQAIVWPFYLFLTLTGAL